MAKLRIFFLLWFMYGELAAQDKPKPIGSPYVTEKSAAGNSHYYLLDWQLNPIPSYTYSNNFEFYFHTIIEQELLAHNMQKKTWLQFLKNTSIRRVKANGISASGLQILQNKIEAIFLGLGFNIKRCVECQKLNVIWDQNKAEVLIQNEGIYFKKLAYQSQLIKNDFWLDLEFELLPNIMNMRLIFYDLKGKVVQDVFLDGTQILYQRKQAFEASFADRDRKKAQDLLAPIRLEMQIMDKFAPRLVNYDQIPAIALSFGGRDPSRRFSGLFRFQYARQGGKPLFSEVQAMIPSEAQKFYENMYSFYLSLDIGMGLHLFPHTDSLQGQTIELVTLGGVVIGSQYWTQNIEGALYWHFGHFFSLFASYEVLLPYRVALNSKKRLNNSFSGIFNLGMVVPLWF